MNLPILGEQTGSQGPFDDLRKAKEYVQSQRYGVEWSVMRGFPPAQKPAPVVVSANWDDPADSALLQDVRCMLNWEQNKRAFQDAELSMRAFKQTFRWKYIKRFGLS